MNSSTGTPVYLGNQFAQISALVLIEGEFILTAFSCHPKVDFGAFFRSETAEPGADSRARSGLASRGVLVSTLRDAHPEDARRCPGSVVVIEKKCQSRPKRQIPEVTIQRRCERSEAIPSRSARQRDCFAALATTKYRRYISCAE